MHRLLCTLNRDTTGGSSRQLLCMNGHHRNLGFFSSSSTQGPVEVVTDGYSFTTSTGSSEDIRRSGPRDLGGCFFCSDLEDWCSKDYICLATYNVDYIYI